MQRPLNVYISHKTPYKLDAGAFNICRGIEGTCAKTKIKWRRRRVRRSAQQRVRKTKIVYLNWKIVERKKNEVFRKILQLIRWDWDVFHFYCFAMVFLTFNFVNKYKCTQTIYVKCTKIHHFFFLRAIVKYYVWLASQPHMFTVLLSSVQFSEDFNLVFLLNHIQHRII